MRIDPDRRPREGGADGRGVPGPLGVLLLSIELALLFLALPLIYAILQPPLHVFAVLWTIAGGCTVSLLLDRGFERFRLWNSADLAARLKPVLVRFVPVAVVTVISVRLFLPEELFALPRHRTGLWALIVVCYPWVSVYPQGLVYRAFFFHRYRALFGSGWAMVAASALLFAFSHVVFRNWPAVALTLLGGILFGRTYMRTRSLLVCLVEHSLYGLLIFSAGLGKFLYLGS